MAEQGRPERLDDPLGVGVLDREPGREVAALRHDLGQPRVDVAFADAAHDGVDEARGARTVDLAGQGDGLVDGGMRRDAHAQQLVRPEPQRVEDVRVDGRHGSTGGDADDGVIEAVHAHGAVDQLCGEGGIAAVDLLVPQHPGQLEVGVGAIRNGPQDGVGREALRIRPAVALARSLRGALRAAVGALRPLPSLGVATTALSWVTHGRTALLSRSGHHEPSRPQPSASCRADARLTAARLPTRSPRAPHASRR